MSEMNSEESTNPQWNLGGKLVIKVVKYNLNCTKHSLYEPLNFLGATER